MPWAVGGRTGASIRRALVTYARSPGHRYLLAHYVTDRSAAGRRVYANVDGLDARYQSMSNAINAARMYFHLLKHWLARLDGRQKYIKNKCSRRQANHPLHLDGFPPA